jgi:hypothetical protein
MYFIISTKTKVFKRNEFTERERETPEREGECG